MLASTSLFVACSWVRGKLLGKGSYGRVYLGLCPSSGKVFAVKQVEVPQTISDRSDPRQIRMVEVLKQECTVLQALSHPHVVRYLGSEETPEYLNM